VIKLRGATVAQARRALAEQFRATGIESPELDVRILIGHALGLDHAGVAGSEGQGLSDSDATRIEGPAARRFAQVTSTDYVQALLDKGRMRAEAEGLPVQFEVADVENVAFALLMIRSRPIVWLVGIEVSEGVGVVEPLITRMSLDAGLLRVGVQFVDVVQG